MNCFINFGLVWHIKYRCKVAKTALDKSGYPKVYGCSTGSVIYYENDSNEILGCHSCVSDRCRFVPRIMIIIKINIYCLFLKYINELGFLDFFLNSGINSIFFQESN